MYPYVLFFTVLSFLAGNDLTNLLLEIKDVIPVISDDKKVITQDLRFEDDAPYFITVEQLTEKLKNGELETETYRLNLALLDPGLTEIKTSKKEMKLILKSNAGNFIAYMKDNEAKGSKDKIEILIEDIDLARNLKEKFNIAITLAKEEWATDLNIPSKENDLKNWIIGKIKSVDASKRTIDQQALNDPLLDDYLTISIADPKKEENIHFSLADIDINKFKIKNEAGIFSLELTSTKGERTIRIINQEKSQRFTNNFKLYFENASQAKAMEMAIVKGNDAFLTIQNKRFQNYANCSSCIDQFSSILINSMAPKANYDLSGNCSALLVETKEDKKTDYTFEWADINFEDIKLVFGSRLPKLTLTTQGKERFITTSMAEKTGYTNEIEMYYNDVESAREALQIIPKIIESCEFEVEIEDPEYIQNHFSINNPFDEKYTQTLAVEEKEPCTFIFTAHEEGKDKLQEYTFNLYDINPASVKADISKNKLTLQLQTLQKQKVITVTNEKGESKFTDKVEMLFGSVNALRTAKETLIEMVNSCTSERED